VKTRSAFYRSPWRFELRDVDISDTPDADWTRLRIETCGICGTDLSRSAEGIDEWQAYGHEIAAVVEAVGPGVSHVSEGDRVVLETCSFSPYSDLSRDGRNDLCRLEVPTFWKQDAMGFSDHMLAPACCLVKYDGLTPEVACMTEPLGVAFDMVKTAEIEMGASVCVLGLGPIGLGAVALAVHRGASEVVCIDLSATTARLALAADMGGNAMAIDDGVGNHPELCRRFDHVLQTAPARFLPASLDLLSFGGRITYVGIGTGSGDITFDANDFHFRKLQMRSSMASPSLYFPAVLRLLKAGVLPNEKLISHRFPLAEIETAMFTARDDKAAALKVVVSP